MSSKSESPLAIEFRTWRGFVKLAKYFLIVLIAGVIVGVGLDRIAVHTDWYQILLGYAIGFLTVHWYLPTGFSLILVVIGYFQIRNWKRKRLEVKQQRIKPS